MEISKILLWVFMILQMVTTFLLIRLVTDFLNRFRLEQASNLNSNNDQAKTDSFS